MSFKTSWYLCAAMFLQFMVLGSWFPVLSAYMTKLGFSGTQIGVIYSLLPAASLITPFVAAQMADRRVNTEKLLALMFLVGGLVLCVMARARTYGQVLSLMVCWSLLYAPSSALINSMTFHYLPKSQTRFSLVRVFGTFGWIVAGLLLSGVRHLWSAQQELPWIGGSDSLWLGGLVSIVFGLCCLKFPKTMPVKNEQAPWAIAMALDKLRVRSVALFMVAFLIMSIAAMFYYVQIAPFLMTIHISSANVPAVLTISQLTEIGAMLLLPWLLKYCRFHIVMLVGIAAWLLRYVVLAYGHPRWLIIIALGLHGLCYACFNVVSYIYMNSIATPDIRASIQAILVFASGAGRLLGSLVTGWVTDYYSVINQGMRTVNYTKVFLLAAGLTFACVILFLVILRGMKASEPVSV
jgi:nucleoside transporter